MAERRPPSVADSRRRESEPARPRARGQDPRPDASGTQRSQKDGPRPRPAVQVEGRTRRDADQTLVQRTRVKQPRVKQPGIQQPSTEKSPTLRAGQVTEAPWVRVGPKSAQIDTVSQRMRDRLAERKRTERRRVLVRVGRWSALAAIVAGALWAFFMSPLFSLDPAKVELSGLSSEIDATAVTAVLASHEGESLALLNVPHVADQLRDISGVLNARVERVWPAGLRVTLEARHPVAAIASGAGFALLDADAIEVGLVDQAPADLPLVSVPVGDDRVLAAVLEVIRNLPADLLARVSGIGAPTEDTVSFVLKDGPRVEWGSSADSALKAQVLSVMLVSGPAASAGVIDVSAPTLPITRAAE